MGYSQTIHTLNERQDFCGYDSHGVHAISDRRSPPEAELTAQAKKTAH